MRISIKIIPLGTNVKLEIRGAHNGPGTYCTRLNQVIATGNRTMNISFPGNRKFLGEILLGSDRALRRFLKDNRPRNLVVESTVMPGLIEQCDRIGK